MPAAKGEYGWKAEAEGRKSKELMHKVSFNPIPNGRRGKAF